MTGQVVIEGSGDASGIEVTATPGGAAARTGSDGAYRLALVPGDYVLEATAPDHEPARVELTVGTLPLGAPLLVLAPRKASIVGRVCAEQLPWVAGSPCGGGAGVVAWADGQGASVVIAGAAGATQATTVDPEGVFRFASLPPGPYTVTATWNGYRATEQSLVVGPGEHLSLDTPLRLAVGRGTITGVVRLAGAERHDGSLVRIGESGPSAETDEAGAFSLPDVPVLVPPGGRIEASRAGYRDAVLAEGWALADLGTLVLAPQALLPTDPGTLELLGATHVRSCDFDLRITSPAAAAYRVSLREDFADATFEALPPPTGASAVVHRTLDCSSLPDGPLVVHVELKTGAGATLGRLSGSALLDRAPPVLTSLSVSGGATIDNGSEPAGAFHTNATDGRVSLAIHASDPGPASALAWVWLDTRPDFAHPLVLDYAPVVSFALPDAAVDGPRDLYVRVLDRAGNAAELVDVRGVPSPLVFVLDRVPPDVLSLRLDPLDVPAPPDPTFTRLGEVLVVSHVDDAEAQDLSMELANDDQSPVPGRTWSERVRWTLAPGNGRREVSVRLRDLAGNLSVPARASITVDATPVAPLRLALVEPVPNHGRVGRAATNPGGLRLSLAGTDLFEFSVGGSLPGGDSPWQPFSTEWSGALAPGDGEKRIVVQARNRAGAVTTADLRFELDTTPPVLPPPSFASAAVGARIVTLSLPATGADLVRIGGDATRVGGTDGPPGWTSYAPSTRVELSAGDGPKRVQVDVADWAGNEASGSALVLLDTAPPGGVLELVGQLGDGTPSGRWTTTRDVLLHLVDPADAQAVRVGGTTLELAAASWRPLGVEPIHFLLSDLDGPQAVYADLRDAAGNVSHLAGAIELAREPPLLGEVRVVSAVGAGGAVGPAALQPGGVQLAFEADRADGLEVSGSIGGGDAGWQPFAPTWAGSLAAGDGAKEIQVQVRSRARVVAAAPPVVFTLDTQPPEMDAPWFDTLVTNRGLQLLHVRATGATRVRVGGDAALLGPDGHTAGWLPFEDELEVELAPGDGPKHVSVEVADDAGNGRTATTSIELDTVVPTATLAVEGTRGDGTPGSDFTTTALINLAVTASDAVQMRVAATATDLATAPWLPFVPASPWHLGDRDGLHQVFVEVRDAAGNVTPLGASLTLDREPPLGAEPSFVEPTLVGGRLDAPIGGRFLVSLSCDDAVEFSVDGSLVAGATGWLPMAPEWIGRLSSSRGPLQLVVRFRDAARLVSEQTVDVLLAPSSLSSRIESGEWTSTRFVTLHLEASGASEIRMGGDIVSVDGDEAAVGDWRAVASAVVVELTPNDGLKSITIEATDATRSEVLEAQNDVFLVTKTPAVNAWLEGLAIDGASSSEITNTPEVTVHAVLLEASPGPLEWRLAHGATALAEAEWSAFEPPRTLLLSEADGPSALYLQLRDIVGNRSPMTRLGIELDTQPPPTPEVELMTPSPFPGFVGADALEPGGLVLKIEAPGASMVRVSGDVAGAPAWEPADMHWEGALQAGDGAKELTVTVRDDAGNVASRSLSFVLDTMAPAIRELELTPFPWVVGSHAELHVTAENALEMRVTGALTTLDGIAMAPGGTWRPFAPSLPVELEAGNGLKEVFVEVRDTLGWVTRMGARTTRDDGGFPAGAKFVNVAAAAGLYAGGDAFGRGAAAPDVDGDGWDDIWLSDQGTLVGTHPNTSRLFRNQHDGTFALMDLGIAPADLHSNWVGAWADYDKDGDQDALFGNGGFGAPAHVALYRNDLATTGHFTNVTVLAGVVTAEAHWWGASWADFDNDGFVDFVVAARDPDAGNADHGSGGVVVGAGTAPIVLFRGLGDGTFEDVSAARGIHGIPGQTRNPVWFDYDDDGDQDLFMASYSQHAFFRNDAGHFTDVTESVLGGLTGMSGQFAEFAALADDFNQDGIDDLYLGRFDLHDYLLLGDGAGGFIQLGAEIGLDMGADPLTARDENTMGLSSGDLDGDGLPEVLIGTGRPNTKSPAIVLCNEGLPLSFRRCSHDFLVGHGAARNHGYAIADFNRDGRNDVFSNLGGDTVWKVRTGETTSQLPALYLQQGTDPPPTASIRLVGTFSNRDAIGARVRVAGSVLRYYTVHNAQGFQGQNSAWLLVSLGTASSGTVTVDWPSGRQTVTTVARGARTVIVE